jgi:hypothetical protein
MGRSSRRLSRMSVRDKADAIPASPAAGLRQPTASLSARHRAVGDHAQVRRVHQRCRPYRHLARRIRRLRCPRLCARSAAVGRVPRGEVR